MTKAELRKEQIKIIIKIALLIPCLVAGFLCLITLKVSAAELESKTVVTRPSSLKAIEGPSQSFLEDWGRDETYVLETPSKTISYDVYASGILDDGTVVYAAKGHRFIAINREGVLTTGFWGGRIVPKRTYVSYNFGPEDKPL